LVSSWGLGGRGAGQQEREGTCVLVPFPVTVALVPSVLVVGLVTITVVIVIVIVVTFVILLIVIIVAEHRSEDAGLGYVPGPVGGRTTLPALLSIAVVAVWVGWWWQSWTKLVAAAAVVWARMRQDQKKKRKYLKSNFGPGPKLANAQIIKVHALHHNHSLDIIVKTKFTRDG
jgi:hypothetical protein